MALGERAEREKWRPGLTRDSERRNQCGVLRFDLNSWIIPTPLPRRDDPKIDEPFSVVVSRVFPRFVLARCRVRQQGSDAAAGKFQPSSDLLRIYQSWALSSKELHKIAVSVWIIYSANDCPLFAPTYPISRLNNAEIVRVIYPEIFYKWCTVTIWINSVSLFIYYLNIFESQLMKHTLVFTKSHLTLFKNYPFIGGIFVSKIWLLEITPLPRVSIVAKNFADCPPTISIASTQSGKWKARTIWRWFINRAARRTLPRINYDECALINYKSINVLPLRWNGQQITRQLACPLRDAANTLLNPSLINHTCAGDTFPRRAIARIDVIIADSLFTTVATMPIFFLERWATLNFASSALITSVFSPSRLFPVYQVLSLINVNVWIVAEGGHATRCGTRTPAANGGRSSGTRGYGWGWKSALESPSSSERAGQVRGLII